MSDSVYKDKDKIELRPGGDDIVVPPDADDSANSAAIPSGNATTQLSTPTAKAGKTPAPVPQVPPVSGSITGATISGVSNGAPQVIPAKDPDDLREVITNPDAPEHEWVAACHELDKHERKQARKEGVSRGRNLILVLIATWVLAATMWGIVFLVQFASPKPDYDSYVAALQKEIGLHWNPPTSNTSSLITVHFKVHKNGEISDIGFDRLTPNAEADAAALKSVIESMPALPALPPGSGDDLNVQFTFEYNVQKLEKSNDPYKTRGWSKFSDFDGADKTTK